MSAEAPWRLRGGWPTVPKKIPDGHHTSLRAAMKFGDAHWRDRALTVTHETTGEQWVRRYGQWSRNREPSS